MSASLRMPRPRNRAKVASSFSLSSSNIALKRKAEAHLGQLCGAWRVARGEGCGAAFIARRGPLPATRIASPATRHASRARARLTLRPLARLTGTALVRQVLVGPTPTVQRFAVPRYLPPHGQSPAQGRDPEVRIAADATVDGASFHHRVSARNDRRADGRTREPRAAARARRARIDRRTRC